MEVVDKILAHPQFIRYMKLNFKGEKRRRFCCHDLQHAVDVARAAYIIALENHLNIKKDIIYAAALLHDIAKWKQYREGLDHAFQGAMLAEEILVDVGMKEQDIALILDAIRSHRSKGQQNTPLSAVLYKGDKACRLCIRCPMVSKCDRFGDGRKPGLDY